MMMKLFLRLLLIRNNIQFDCCRLCDEIRIYFLSPAFNVTNRLVPFKRSWYGMSHSKRRAKANFGRDYFAFFCNEFERICAENSPPPSSVSKSGRAWISFNFELIMFIDFEPAGVVVRVKERGTTRIIRYTKLSWVQWIHYYYVSFLFVAIPLICWLVYLFPLRSDFPFALAWADGRRSGCRDKVDTQ